MFNWQWLERRNGKFGGIRRERVTKTPRTGRERAKGQHPSKVRLRRQSQLENSNPKSNLKQVKDPDRARIADLTSTKPCSVTCARVSTVGTRVSIAATYNLNAKNAREKRSISNRCRKQREKQPQPKRSKRYIYSIMAKTRMSILTIQ